MDKSSDRRLPRQRHLHPFREAAVIDHPTATATANSSNSTGSAGIETALLLLNSPSWRHPGFAPYWPVLERLRALLLAEWRVVAREAGMASGVGAGGGSVEAPGRPLEHDGLPGANPGVVGGGRDAGGAGRLDWLDPAEPSHWSSAVWLPALNQLVQEADLRSAVGAPLRFVLAEGDGALDYERRILDAGEIACRPQGAGARHDFHNALVWLCFPLLKTICNWLHCQAGSGGSGGSGGPASASPAHEPSALGWGPDRSQPAGRKPAAASTARAGGASRAVAAVRVKATRGAAGGRGHLRDAITLLDENGALWPGPTVAWAEHLRARRWQALFVAGRQALLDSPPPAVVGHGLMEKLHRPYKSMTAKLLSCVVLGAAHPSDADGGRNRTGAAAGVEAGTGAGAGVSRGADVPGGRAEAHAAAPTLPEGQGGLHEECRPMEGHGRQPDVVALDRGAAQQVLEMAERGSFRPAVLLPLPLQGWPGWDPVNQDPAYYEDAGVFRPPRAS